MYASTSKSLASPSGRSSIVTGANGYVGRAVVHELLKAEERDILCLVRPQRIKDEEMYWKDHFKNDSENCIRVFPYDMLDGGESLEKALEATDGSSRCVYHIASVFGPTEDHKQTALDNVKGTEDVVHILAKAGRCKLVLTSSMAAVRGTGQNPSNGKFYTHKDWNVKSELGVNWGASYQWSKMKSEKRAWELSSELNVPMVSVCPSFVFGPPYSKSSSYSIVLVGQWARGESPVQSRLFVDVRDCAKAHVEAGMREAAIGKRYLVTTEARVPSQTIASWLQEVCKRTKLSDPDKIHYDANFDGGAIKIGDREVEAEQRLKDDLGIDLHPVEDTIADMAKVLLEVEAII